MSIKLGSLLTKVEALGADAARKAETVAAEVPRAAQAVAKASVDGFETVDRKAVALGGEVGQMAYDYGHATGNPAFLPAANIGSGTTLGQLNTVLDAATGSQNTQGNTVSVFVDGQNALPPILSSIDSAKQSICYESYEFDGSGQAPQAVVDHLIAAEKRGVQVRLVADAGGSRELLGKTNPMLDQLRKAGVDVQVYHPFDTLSSLDISRDHRKSIVVDGQTAWVGGMNTGDKYLGGPSVPGRLHDIFTRIQGPAVPAVLGDFLSSWQAAGGAPASPASLTAPLAAGQSATPGTTPVRIIEHTPGQDANIRTAYLAMINHATRSISVENSYPMSGDLVQALIAAQRRGVDVKYIVGTHQGLIGEEARSNFQQLVDAGAHVYLYPTPIHTKSLSVDGEICSVGSSNVDDVALTRNREIVSVIADPSYTQAYDQAVFAKDVVGTAQGQKTIELKAPFSEPLWRRVADAVLTDAWRDSLD